jgi:hypothetical protein
VTPGRLHRPFSTCSHDASRSAFPLKGPHIRRHGHIKPAVDTAHAYSPL